MSEREEEYYDDKEVDLFDIPDTDGIEEPVCVEAGEMRVRIDGVIKMENNYKYFLGVIEEPNARVITHTMWLSKEGDTEVQVNRTKLGWKRFKEAFGLEAGKMTKSEQIGKECWALVAKKIGKNPEYADKDGFENTVSRFL